MTHYPKFFLIKGRILVGHVYNLKTVKSSNYCHFGRIDQNTLMKRCQKFGQGPPFLIWTKSKRTGVFPQDTFPKVIFEDCSQTQWQKQPTLFRVWVSILMRFKMSIMCISAFRI